MRLPLILVSLALLGSSPLCAWTDATYQRIGKKGTDLAPPDMRLLIEKHADDFRRGLEVDDLTESRHVFVVASRRGTLRSELHAEVRSAIKKVREQRSMSEVVESLGRIAHLTADVNNPFVTANAPARVAESRLDFEQYLERKLTKFPTVFYGLQRDFKLEPYFDAALIRASNFYPLLDEEYFRGGERHTSDDFDDRSTAFGIAAVSYSRSVSDLVNVYYYIWKEAGGDVRSSETLRRGNLLLNE